eukprot:4285383-Ditylum_brightwellii.AAC.1
MNAIDLDRPDQLNNGGGLVCAQDEDMDKNQCNICQNWGNQNHGNPPQQQVNHKEPFQANVSSLMGNINVARSKIAGVI